MIDSKDHRKKHLKWQHLKTIQIGVREIDKKVL